MHRRDPTRLNSIAAELDSAKACNDAQCARAEDMAAARMALEAASRQAEVRAADLEAAAEAGAAPSLRCRWGTGLPIRCRGRRSGNASLHGVQTIQKWLLQKLRRAEGPF
jgi:hypothetical protein